MYITINHFHLAKVIRGRADICEWRNKNNNRKNTKGDRLI